MVTTPEPREAPTTTKEDLASTLSNAGSEASRLARTILTGDTTSRPRRNALYVIALAGIVLGLPLIAALPLLLLALTDAVTE